jgi:hypothetical protein
MGQVSIRNIEIRAAGLKEVNPRHLAWIIFDDTLFAVIDIRREGTMRVDDVEFGAHLVRLTRIIGQEINVEGGLDHRVLSAVWSSTVHPLAKVKCHPSCIE